MQDRNHLLYDCPGLRSRVIEYTLQPGLPNGLIDLTSGRNGPGGGGRKICPREKTISSNIKFAKGGNSACIYAHCCTYLNMAGELGLPYVGSGSRNLLLVSFEFAVPFLLSADVLPSRGNSKLTTANQVQSPMVRGSMENNR